MVVGGDRERPGAEQPIVVQHQVRRGFRGTVRVQTLVDETVHAHESFGGPGHELPQSRRTDLGIGGEIER